MEKQIILIVLCLVLIGALIIFFVERIKRNIHLVGYIILIVFGILGIAGTAALYTQDIALQLITIQPDIFSIWYVVSPVYNGGLEALWKVLSILVTIISGGISGCAILFGILGIIKPSDST